MRKVAGWHEAEHILEHLPSDIEQYLLYKVKISSEKEIEKLKKKIEGLNKEIEDLKAQNKED